ncbi:MAG: hypothetical protein J6L86_01390 [Alphaproteobacteria bacterium]|nr:hypothetical protein [Alphaproteobacteria bacterium]
MDLLIAGAQVASAALPFGHRRSSARLRLLAHMHFLFIIFRIFSIPAIMKSNIKYFNMKNQGTIKKSICHNQDLNQSIGHFSTFILT